MIQQKEQEGPKESSEEFQSDKIKIDGVNGAAELSPDTFGQIRISNSGNETSYVGAGHWSSVLKELEEVKNSLEEDEIEEAQDEDWDDVAARSAITFGVAKRITKAQLIEEMPPKDEVDRLLPLWFNR